MKAPKYILFLTLLGFCFGCSLTRNLEKGQLIVYENKIEGIKSSNQEELYGLIEQEPNTRFLGVSVGVLIHRFGSNFFDSTRVAGKLNAFKEELEQLRSQRDTLIKEVKQRKREEKLQSRISALENKLEYGNAIMRTGNPVVILDSSLIEKSSKNMKGYLNNHGFFDSEVQFSVSEKKQKASISFLITESKPYLIDSIFTRAENPDILRLLSEQSGSSLIKKGDIYDQNHIGEERNRLEEVLKNNGYYMFSKSYINYIAYTDTTSKTIRLEQQIQRPSFAEKHEVYTIDSISVRRNPPSDEFAERYEQTAFQGLNFYFYRDRYSPKILA